MEERALGCWEGPGVVTSELSLEGWEGAYGEQGEGWLVRPREEQNEQRHRGKKGKMTQLSCGPGCRRK